MMSKDTIRRAAMGTIEIALKNNWERDEILRVAKQMVRLLS